MKSIKYRIIIFILVIISNNASTLYAQNIYWGADTLIPRGKTYLIPVYGSSLGDSTKSIKINFTYKSGNVIYVKNVETGNQTVFCQNPQFTDNRVNLDSITVSISCSQVNPGAGNTLFFLDVEALAGPDTSAIIRIDSLLVNDSGVILSSNKIIRISTNGPPVHKQLTEGIGLGYPNPIPGGGSSFPFNIKQDTRVNFYIYDVGGNLVLSSDEVGDESIMSIKKVEQGVTFDIKGALPPGSYLLQFNPVSWQFSSGMYFLTMKTANGFYSTNFLYLK